MFHRKKTTNNMSVLITIKNMKESFEYYNKNIKFSVQSSKTGK